jgi:gliding motility-associated-like protein
VKDSVTITIFNCNVFVPNAFSPNDDGVNDKLYVRSLCMKTMDFAVFDRFGNKIFETESEEVPWDGTYKGKPMPIGTYMWYLTGVLTDGTRLSKSGNVTLVR